MIGLIGLMIGLIMLCQSLLLAIITSAVACGYLLLKDATDSRIVAFHQLQIPDADGIVANGTVEEDFDADSLFQWRGPVIENPA